MPDVENSNRRLRVSWRTALLAVLLLQPACSPGEDDTKRVDGPASAPKGESEVPSGTSIWSAVRRPSAPRGSASRTFRHPIGPSAGGEADDSEHLTGIALAKNPTKDDVRRYGVEILAAAAEHRAGTYALNDPEIDLLRRVGSDNVDVLVEALLHFPLAVWPSTYVIEAIKSLVEDRHKQLILDAMPSNPASQGLVEVVVAKDWTADAAPTLLRVLAERSPHTMPSLEWIRAAARVARPESYGDLKFWFVHGPSPIHVWREIRRLPGFEPLDELVAERWRTLRREASEWERRHFAVIAAYYGHADALQVLVEDLTKNDMAWWAAFVELTGHGVGQSDFGREEEAQEWFAKHRGQLIYERSRMRYVLK
jgi:hypothetical protein